MRPTLPLLLLATSLCLVLSAGCGSELVAPPGDGGAGGPGDGGGSSSGGRSASSSGSGSGSGGQGSSSGASSGSSGGASSGSSGGGSGSGSSGGADGGVTAHKRIFVTSTTYAGDLGGVAGADAKCAIAAQAAQLGGTWKAWISSSSVDAIDRIAEAGPWYLVDGQTRVFNDKANLLTSPLAPISLDENGHAWQGVGLYGTWSGSDDHGARDQNPYDDYCADWSSATPSDQATTGSPAQATQSWGGGGAPLPCDGTNSLLCLEQ